MIDLKSTLSNCFSIHYKYFQLFLYTAHPLKIEIQKRTLELINYETNKAKKNICKIKIKNMLLMCYL